MNPHFERALVFFDSPRRDLAERELWAALAAEPGHADAHAMLALCLSERKKHRAARAEAEEAVRLAPAASYPLYALAWVNFGRGWVSDAEETVLEAIRIEPDRPEYIELLALVRFNQWRYREALTTAERGLRLAPTHLGCLRQRAAALRALGRRPEADEALELALSLDPANPYSHAEKGWADLARGDAVNAADHFREALRQKPELEWARQGIVEALRARFFFYRPIRAYHRFMEGFEPAYELALGAAGAGVMALMTAARNNDASLRFYQAVAALFLAFVGATWLAEPVANLLLRASRFGRLILSPEERMSSSWVGRCLSLGLVTLVAGLTTGEDLVLFAAAYFGLLALPVSQITRCPPVWPRRGMAAYVALLAAVGPGAAVAAFADSPVTLIVVNCFLLGVAGSGAAAHILSDPPWA